MHIQRTLPRPKDIVALAAHYLPNQLPAVAGLAHDLLDRHSAFGRRWWLEMSAIFSPHAMHESEAEQ
jgi:hypothetical protein